jgi:histone H3/H4
MDEQRSKLQQLLVSQLQSNTQKPNNLDERALLLLTSYIKEISSAIIEQSVLVARHRKSNKVEADDVSLILGSLIIF